MNRVDPPGNQEDAQAVAVTLQPESIGARPHIPWNAEWCSHMRTSCVVLVLASLFTASADAQRRPMTPEERAARAAAREAEMNAPRPIEAVESVWLEELTWMEIRDAVRAGNTTALILTGGVESNGPHLASGKHNYSNKLMG